MNTITAKPITHENFHAYGNFCEFLDPIGDHFGDDIAFYPDRVTMGLQSGRPAAFSPLVVKKPEKMIVSAAEYHNYSDEGIFVLDDDAIIHVAPPSGGAIVPEKTEAFIVKKGTYVQLNAGVWHLAALPVHNEVLHVMIVLAERTYAVDCIVCDYPEERQVEIVL